jgi:hypothetical protein
MQSKKPKKTYDLEEDMEKVGRRGDKLKASQKRKKEADKKKAEEGDWVKRLRTKVKKYLKGERKAKKKKEAKK